MLANQEYKDIVHDITSKFKNCSVFKTSSKTGENVQKIFKKIATDFYKENPNIRRENDIDFEHAFPLESTQNSTGSKNGGPCRC